MKAGYNGKYTNNNGVKTTKTTAKPISKKAIARRKERIRKMRIKMLISAFKWFIARLILGAGLIICLSGCFAIVLGFLIVGINPDSVFGYVVMASGLGYSFVILNCRIYEYIGDRMHGKF